MASTVTEVDRNLRVTERIHANRALMSVAMRKIADVVLADPTAPLELSITELADRAGTSPATVTRFCRQLGYPGYVQFRVGVATDSGRGEDPDAETWRLEMGRTLDPDDSPDDVLRALLNAHVRSLRATADVLDLARVTEVARRITGAAHLDIYGTGGSFSMADEMRTRLYRIGVNAHSWGDVHAGLASASIQGPRTTAIGISNSGRTRETIDMLARAQRSGAFTVAITSFPSSPLAQLADVSLLASVPEQYLHPADLSAKHSQLFVLDVLYLIVAQQDYSGAAAKIAASADAVAARRRPD
ncbi:MurR/RpiR family transcriptional regulator [Ruania suaedae]|uniref:MurR/RpiR family transcriptional regulator n=1 Tax=Ruania suaedae TaxID=2897774 RepID=UPI001E4BE9F3|nr:MurR/RpiR family transcriptional regulator [Ruania suaedae]UFU04422.1 MurR/RpiR family transcriptional regulator [Ruania suaedae]